MQQLDHGPLPAGPIGVCRRSAVHRVQEDRGAGEAYLDRHRDIEFDGAPPKIAPSGPCGVFVEPCEAESSELFVDAVEIGGHGVTVASDARTAHGRRDSTATVGSPSIEPGVAYGFEPDHRTAGASASSGRHRWWTGQLHRCHAPHGSPTRRPLRARRRGVVLRLRNVRMPPGRRSASTRTGCTAMRSTMLDAEAERTDGADVVAIMTPNDSHQDYAIAALRRGFDVICDKPMTNTLAEAREVLAAGRVERTCLLPDPQLHRVSDGAPGAGDGGRRPTRPRAIGAGRIRAGRQGRATVTPISTARRRGATTRCAAGRRS